MSNLHRNFLNVGLMTTGSRILGFVRDALVAAVLGTGPAADAYLAAFRFPNLFRRLFAEGAFNTAFVPLFAKEIEAGGMDGAKRFSEEVFGVLFSALIVLTIVMELAMPFLVSTIIAPGFAGDPEKYDLTVALATVMFPYLVCMSLASMMAGMLNSLRRYFAAAIAPVFLNVILIAVLYWAWRSGADGLAVGHWMAWGVMAAGVVQLAIVWVAARHAGIAIGFRRPHLTPGVKRLLLLALPAAVTGGITQINQLIGTAIASTQDSAVASLALADRVYLQNRSVEFTLFLTLPAAAALLVMSEPIVRVLYERGAFAANNSTPVVAAILAIFGLGLPAFVLIKAFTPGYFAREDTKTPMIFAAVSVVVNVATALALFPSMGAPGIAVASAVAGWLNAGMLLFVLVRRGHWGREAALMKRIPRLVLSAALMGAALWYAQDYLAAELSSSARLVTKAATLALLSGAGAVLYFALAFATGGADVGMIRRNMRRGGKAGAKPAQD